jgi:hypothetical protein
MEERRKNDTSSDAICRRLDYTPNPRLSQLCNRRPAGILTPIGREIIVKEQYHGNV